ncbi:MAG: thiamine-phosphate kinase, partial [Gemmataceae bacterium]
PIIGGDTNTWDGPLTISVTIFGEPGPGGIVRRNGCREGDWLLVTGALGGSIRGKHLEFTPRVREALFLAGNFSLHGMIDISDGLASDLHKLCQESGCGATLWEDSIPITPEAQAMGNAVSPLDHALGDGEDYELLFSLPEKEARKLLQSQPIPGLTLHGIGQCIAGGIWLEKEGRRLPLPPRGWVHAME